MEIASVLQKLKAKIQQARLKAAIAVNQELIKLYWEIGKTLYENQQNKNWGSRAIELIGQELQKSFPGIAGFSRANLFKMRSFYLSYKKVSQTVRQFEKLPFAKIPWGHNIVLMTKIKNIKERFWYTRIAVEEGWSRKTLEDAISSNYSHRYGKAITNFKP